MYILLLNSLFYDARDKHDTYFVTKLIHNEHSSIKNYHIGVLHSLSQNVLEKLPVTKPVRLTAGAAPCLSLSPSFIGNSSNHLHEVFSAHNNEQRFCHRQHRLSTLNPVAQQFPADLMTLGFIIVTFRLSCFSQNWAFPCERTSSTATL